MVQSNEVKTYGLLLSSDQSAALRGRAKNLLPENDDYVFDGRLLDLSKEIWSSPNYKWVLDGLADSIHDKNCTKHFCHRQATLQNLDAYFYPEPRSAAWQLNFQAAVGLLEYAMRITPLQPITLTMDVDESLLWTNKQASAGALGSGTKEENRDLCIKTALLIERSIRDGVPFSKLWIPAIPGHRAQISNYMSEDGRRYDGSTLNKKDRLVWMIDGGTVTFEAKFAQPLYQHLKECWFNYVGGDSPELLRKKVSVMRRGRYWISCDYSKFDQTIPSWLIWTCFGIIKKFFSPRYHRELEWICYNFIHTVLLMPGGGTVTVWKGIPSGSDFTQIVGTMANFLMAFTYLASLEQGSREQKERSIQRYLDVRGSNVKARKGDLSALFLGDDSIIFSQEKINAIEFSKYVHKVFGVMVKPEKSEQGLTTDAPSFLRRQWLPRMEYRNPLDMLVNVIHYERERSYDGYAPIHILYGLFCTYQGAFPPELTEYDMVLKMREAGGVLALQNVRLRDLPGVLRARGEEGRQYLIDRALRKERELLNQRVA
jgi:hypothetical protein